MKKLKILVCSVITFLEICYVSFSIFAVENNVQNEETYYLKNIYSEKYMQISDSKIYSGIIQNTFTGDINQQFTISQVDTNMNGNIVYIAPVAIPELRFDIANASTKNGTKVQLYKNNPSYANAQHFFLVTNEDGTYRIISNITETEKVLEVAGPSKLNAAVVQMWDYVGADNQKWILEPAESKLKITEDTISIQLEQKIYDTNLSKIDLSITNNSSFVVSFGRSYKIEKFTDNKWGNYPITAYWDLDAIALNPGANIVQNITLIHNKNDTFTPGLYRIIKDFSSNTDLKSSFPISVEFEVK